MTQKLFLTGATGYIGGAVLHELVQNHKDRFTVTALVRTEANAAKVLQHGADHVVLGGYDPPDLLVKAARESDIFIHVGDSADHLPAAKAVLQGISERLATQKPLIYVHTSGTGVLSDTAHGDVEGKQVYDDDNQSEIDTLDPKQPHREIDIYVRDQALKSAGKAVVAIIIPPNIYGVGTGPVGKISIQTPHLIRFAIKHRFTPQVGPGVNWWNNVHVKDLARGYVKLVDALVGTSDPWSGYWFAETGQHQWCNIYTKLGKVLKARGLVDSEQLQSPAKKLGAPSDFQALMTGKDVYDAWGSNSRGKASRLRALGWQQEEVTDVYESIDFEVEAIVNL